MTENNQDNTEREDNKDTEDPDADDGDNVHLTGILPVERPAFLDIP